MHEYNAIKHQYPNTKIQAYKHTNLHTDNNTQFHTHTYTQTKIQPYTYTYMKTHKHKHKQTMATQQHELHTYKHANIH